MRNNLVETMDMKNETDKEFKDYELEECRFLRTEILQYLEEYQTVRNMMYAVTGTLLGFGIGTGKAYLLLLPLLVIIPSYFITLDYEKCVNAAATYLKVFYEQKEGFPVRWETRKVYLDFYLRKSSEKYIPSFNKQKLPYRISALACVGTYFGRWYIDYASYWVNLFSGEKADSGAGGIFMLLLGIAVSVLVYLTVFQFKTSANYEECWKAWEKIRERELKGGMVYDAQTVFDEIEREAVDVDFFTKMKWLLSGKNQVM